jgi:hypothetical protein
MEGLLRTGSACALRRFSLHLAGHYAIIIIVVSNSRSVSFIVLDCSSSSSGDKHVEQ